MRARPTHPGGAFPGRVLVQGTHAPADPESAAIWYRRAAEDGHVISLCHLAELHERPGCGAGSVCRSVAEGDSNPAKLQMASFHLEEPEEPGPRRRHRLAPGRRAGPLGGASYQLGVIARDDAANAAAALAWFERAAAWGYAPPADRPATDAPIDPDRDAKSRDVAKAYLWLTALRVTRGRGKSSNSDMIETLLGVMPATWLPDLDAKVERHFAKFEQDLPARGKQNTSIASRPSLWRSA